MAADQTACAWITTCGVKLDVTACAAEPDIAVPPSTAKAAAKGAEERNSPASESAAGALPFAARSARNAGVKLTSGANNASMIRPSRTLPFPLSV